MAPLSVRDVPEPVAEALKARPTNAEIVARLKTRNRSNGPSAHDILQAVHEGRR